MAVLFMAITIVCYSYLPAVYQFLNPIPFIADSIQMVCVALLLISFLDINRSSSNVRFWRIGIDYDEKTELVVKGYLLSQEIQYS